MSPVAVILAAGKGTRMGSDLPKVLHPLLGVPLVVHPIRAAQDAGVTAIILVVGHGAAAVKDALGPVFPGLQYALQAEQRGTGHAVACALPELAGHEGPVLILSGDVPGLHPETLRALQDRCSASPAGLALATFVADDPRGYGRIVRGADGRIAAIVEERDADAATRAIRECNAGVYCVMASLLRRELPRIGAANAQGEIYLTDLVARVAATGVETIEVPADEVAGVNTPEQLAAIAARMTGRVGAV